MAYNDKGQLFNPRPVVYECGPWAGCPDGKECKLVRCREGLALEEAGSHPADAHPRGAPLLTTSTDCVNLHSSPPPTPTSHTSLY